MNHLINWKKSDITKLKRTVNRFNSVVDNLSNTDIKKISFAEIKEEILTRKELNRQIEKLNRLTEKTAETWGENEQKREIKLAERRLKRMLKSTEKGSFMGNEQQQYIEGELRNINNFENLPNSFMKRKIERIEQLARADYEMKTAQNYKEWYVKSIKEYYGGFKGADKLIDRLKGIKNPEKFYKRISMDINARDINLIRYGKVTQEFFNKILNAWGMSDEDGEESEIYG